MRETHILSISPSGPGVPAIAIATCLAGERGCIDAEFNDSAAIFEQVRLLRRYTENPFGIRVAFQTLQSLKLIFDDESLRPDFVLITGGIFSEQKKWIAFCMERKISVLFEAISVEEAKQAVALEVDEIVLKGNESGGRIGHDTSFIIVQKWNDWLANSDGDAKGNASADEKSLRASAKKTPFSVQGGIGLNTAAACMLAGANGVVLDSQLHLAKESMLAAPLKQWIASSDGSDSRVLGDTFGCSTRIVHRPKSRMLDELQKVEIELSSGGNNAKTRKSWRTALQIFVDADSGDAQLFGQDIAFAKSLADQFVTVGGIISGIKEHVANSLKQVTETQPLIAGASLAKSHGTEFPLLQGPMTRVSDTADFCKSVADGGALPFLALAVMRGEECDKLLGETKTLLGDQSWGAGILGFLPAAVRDEQNKAVLKHKPPFCLIAGGRPDQAKQFEDVGIPTYLHVPSPGLLKMFLRDGATRFIFEGRECGGHVGPRSSFILWQSMCDTLTDWLDNDRNARGKADKIHIVFAGGIHDGLSAGMVSALVAPLAARGVKVGGLMGTAYLFTEEAVKAGAIVDRFQKEAIGCDDTVLLKTGPGHAIRCVKTPYFDVFESEKQRLMKEGKTHEEIVRTLEAMNIGRLRVASKGVDRKSGNSGVRKLEPVSGKEQYDRGMYMIGQVAGMHRKVTSIRKLHESVCNVDDQRVSADATKPQIVVKSEERKLPPSDIAIIGMGCNYPDAETLDKYWENILKRHYAVTEVPITHWDWRLYYDPDPKTPDRIYSKWGGFLKDSPFDPMRYGITPKSMEVIEPLQLLVLDAVRFALADAGYENRPFDRERTAAILGIGGGGGPMSIAYGFRTCMRVVDYIDGMPIESDDIVKLADEQLPEWTEDSFPGMLGNVCAGRVANRFNLGGPNYAIDAACASSLASLDCCVRELEMGTADMAIAMGADAVQTPLAFMAFSKTHALSASGRIRPFDAEGDGIVLSEGIGVVVLKRLADAKRDGDRIYGVIKGMGSSSDGKEKGLTAPNTAGQQRALRRAYEKANVSPATLGLVEAHGTGTVVGDQTEANSLSNFMKESGASQQSCALGSVKSMIGHSKCAAGVAGLIKSTLALHRKTLPATLVETPNPKAKFEESALYLNTETRPWIKTSDEPRRAGVSAFGFGGTNFHAVVEEYADDYLQTSESVVDNWSSELLIWRRKDGSAIRSELEKLFADLSGKHEEAELTLANIALAVSRRNVANTEDGLPTLSIIATSLDDLKSKIESAIDKIKADEKSFADPRGIYYNLAAKQNGKIAFLFPGQGSQYPNMLAETAVAFPTVRESLDRATVELNGEYDRPFSHFIYPPSVFSDDQRKHQQRDLAQTDVAQPAIGATSIGLMNLLGEFGVRPDATAGHSYGEYTALACAGVIDTNDLTAISFQRGKVIKDAAGDTPSGMIAVDTNAATAKEILKKFPNATVSNMNSPDQTVISLANSDIETVRKAFEAKQIRVREIPVALGFHSAFVADASERLGKRLAEFNFASPSIDAYSNSTGAKHKVDPKQVAELLSSHLCNPVRFIDEIRSMYNDGVRVFVEVGPHHVLTNLTKQILGSANKTDYLAVASDVKGRGGLAQLQHCLAQLAVAGINVDTDRLFAERKIESVNLDRLPIGKPEFPANYWLVNGVRSKPINGPEPLLLGQPPRSHTEKTNESQAAPTTSAPTTSAPSTSAPLNSAPSNSAPTKKPTAATPSNETTKPNRASGNNTAASAQGRTQQSPAPKPGNANTHSGREATKPMSNFDNNGHLSHGSQADADQCDVVMQTFQQVMAKFLDTQRDVMMSYLQGDEYVAPPQPAAGIASASSNMVSHVPAPAQDQAPNRAPRPQAQQPIAPKEVPASTAPTANGSATSSAPADSRNGSQNGSASSEQPAASADQISNRMNKQAATASELVPATAETASEKPSNGKVDSSEPALTREAIHEQLLSLVSDRTGYPADMLDPDLDLEADLGIDSIKRVEILGSLAEFITPDAQMGDESDINLETLSGLRTLRLILDYLEDTLPMGEDEAREDKAAETEDPSQKKKLQSGESLSDEPAVEAVNSPEDDSLLIKRGLVKLVDAPLPASTTPVMPAGAVVITADDQGIAEQCADRLTDYGLTAVVVSHNDSSNATTDAFAADLSDETSVQQLVSRLHEEVGRVAGLIHILPLGTTNDIARWDQRANLDVCSLYLLCRTLESDLCESGEAGGAFVLSTTMMGGSLGFGNEPMENLARIGAGGTNGFLKCVGMEWPNVLARSIDLHHTIDANEVVDVLQAELGDPGGPFEVGHKDGRRVTWEPVAGTFEENAEQTIKIENDDTILITGGARGITAAIATEIANHFQPNLILVGRSSIPNENENATTAGLDDKADIKRALINQLRDSGETPAPAKVESMFRRLHADREIRGNLEAIRQTGATVEYHSVDVRDEHSLSALCADITDRFGAIDGVIHGAGIIDDKLLKDKTPESFDRVFGTKVNSAATFTKVLDPGKLKFFALFASIASRYGNRGQSDYAAANDVLCKLASELDRRWSGRAFAVAWGPWSGLGMVSDLEKHLAARGIALIDQHVGSRMFVEELIHGRKGDSEIIIAGGAENLVTPSRNQSDDPVSAN